MTQTMTRAISAYRTTSASVHPLVAVVRLFDEMLVQIRRGVQAIEARRHEDSFIAIAKAGLVLQGLSHNLRFDMGGDVAETLLSTYTKNCIALHTAYGKPDAVARYRTIAAGLAELRDAWAQAAGMRTLAEEAQMVSAPGPRRS
ncbi:flagellar export chaperone FliS [Phreatobacter cathodiphilus]|uniref:Flagellar protein FliS n=1 Tax=Phreatobacter cathodiphilus TaxID=1868589 RepID=A0A2S0ND43_9HYPH|nr:flagellar export chaperone FliS [Phreatobacter cathodiphilus]AVO45957.1 flagellar protein FliS [Phreatobacter cathodiphilus]